jgi:hypothetical protein
MDARGQRIKSEIRTGDGRHSQMYKTCPTTRYGEALGKQQTERRKTDLILHCKNMLETIQLDCITMEDTICKRTLNYKPKWRTDLETSYGDERTNYKSLSPEMSLNKCQV